MILYIGGPIDRAAGDPLLKQLRDEVDIGLADSKFSGFIFRPEEAWRQVHASNEAWVEFADARVVRDIDLVAVASAGACIFILPSKVPTYGTVVEIEHRMSSKCHYHKRADRGCCVYTDNRQAFHSSAFLLAHAVPIFDMQSKLVDWIDNLEMSDTMLQIARIGARGPQDEDG